MEKTEETQVENTVKVEEENIQYIGKRIIFKYEKATVKYAGKLLHEVSNPKIKKDALWLGVEWDNTEKGKIMF